MPSSVLDGLLPFSILIRFDRMFSDEVVQAIRLLSVVYRRTAWTAKWDTQTPSQLFISYTTTAVAGSTSGIWLNQLRSGKVTSSSWPLARSTGCASILTRLCRVSATFWRAGPRKTSR